MNDIKRSIILVVVLVVIGGTIWFLESKKPLELSGPAANVLNSPILSSGTASSSESRGGILTEKAKEFPKAKEIVDPTGFINTPPFKLSDIVGKKVILIDFWTYSCINCIRTLPYLKAWYQKYKDYGLEIVGVHTPEFDFEKDYGNVSQAVKKDGISYPVVLDSNYGTWNAYNNQYWPNEYLIDIDGYIVHNSIGEGNYSETEQAIQKALIERAQVLGLPNNIPTTITNPSDLITMNANDVQSPETYFGSQRNQFLGNGSQSLVGVQNLNIPSSISTNTLYLGGSWNFQNQYAEATSSGSVVFEFNAKNVYFVASSNGGAKIKVSIDGQSLGSEAGADVSPDGTVLIKENRLYSLINGSSYGQHTLKSELESGTLDAYTFTFG